MEHTYKSITLTDYHTFLAFADSDPDYLQEAIKDYETILKDSGNRIKTTFQVAGKAAQSFGGWTLLACSKELSFYDFINLPSWGMYYGGEHETRKARFYLGIAMHQENPAESFVFMPARNNSQGDMVEGYFQDGSAFTVFMPAAFYPGGNIEIQSLPNSDSAMSEVLRVHELSPECFAADYYQGGQMLEGMFEPE